MRTKVSRMMLLALGTGAAIAAISGCTSNSSDEAGSKSSGGFTYSTTSNKGDYAEWTFKDKVLQAKWQEINNTGGTDRTFNITAQCDGYDSQYNYYTCDITDANCVDGDATCNGSPSGQIKMMEVPGVAIFVHPEDPNSNDQLHVGFLKDGTACAADISGDYVFTHTAIGSKELVGVYRSDGNFVDITHSDFIMKSVGEHSTPNVEYLTGDAEGKLTFGTPNACDQGVRERTIGGMKIRSMITSAGVFVLDLPAGMGGLIAVKKEKTAQLSDFANKQFAGIVFADSGDTFPMSMKMGAVSGSTLAITEADVPGLSPGGTIELRPLSNTSSLATSPAYPNFTLVSDGNPSNLYADNALSASYSSLAAVPGLFRIDGDMADGRVIVTAGKFNGKVVAFGVVYNWRQQNHNGNAKYDTDGLYSAGNFILFER